ncbi:MAG TPA: hypothetical protein V6C89_03930 [Drouetiella sp.]
MKNSFTVQFTLLVLLFGSCSQLRAQTLPGDSDPRHNQIYALLQAGKAHEALMQLNTVTNPGAWDFYMRGQACQMLGEAVKAAEWYKTAVAQEGQNDYYRTKAVDSLLAVCRCDEAIQVCSEGSKLAPDARRRQRYDNKIKDIERLKQSFVTAADNIARHKREHASQLQQAMETSK